MNILDPSKLYTVNSVDENGHFYRSIDFAQLPNDTNKKFVLITGSKKVYLSVELYTNEAALLTLYKNITDETHQTALPIINADENEVLDSQSKLYKDAAFTASFILDQDNSSKEHKAKVTFVLKPGTTYGIEVRSLSSTVVEHLSMRFNIYEPR